MQELQLNFRRSLIQQLRRGTLPPFGLALRWRGTFAGAVAFSPRYSKIATAAKKVAFRSLARKLHVRRTIYALLRRGFFPAFAAATPMSTFDEGLLATRIFFAAKRRKLRCQHPDDQDGTDKPLSEWLQHVEASSQMREWERCGTLVGV